MWWPMTTTMTGTKTNSSLPRLTSETGTVWDSLIGHPYSNNSHLRSLRRKVVRCNNSKIIDRRQKNNNRRIKDLVSNKITRVLWRKTYRPMMMDLMTSMTMMTGLLIRMLGPTQLLNNSSSTPCGLRLQVSLDREVSMELANNLKWRRQELTQMTWMICLTALVVV